MRAKALADEFGVQKKTVFTWIDELGLTDHVNTSGYIHEIDEYATDQLRLRAAELAQKRSKASSTAEKPQKATRGQAEAIEGLKTALKALETVNKAQELRIGSLETDNAVLKQQLEDLKKENQHYKEALIAIENSPFWRGSKLARQALALPAPSDNL